MRSIPLLIESIEKGFGLGVKCAAVAALEKFHGNPALWINDPPPSHYLKAVGMKRVFPEINHKIEREKWERVFAEEIGEE